MKSRFVRYLLWWSLVLLTFIFSFGLWATPVGDPIQFGRDEPIFIPEWSFSMLPTFTVAELEAMRGSPIHPGNPDTLYFPPGVNNHTELPPCKPSTVDDPTTEIDEAQAEYERRMRDGTRDRNLALRVVGCRVIPDPSSGISMTVEEYER